MTHNRPKLLVISSLIALGFAAQSAHAETEAPTAVKRSTTPTVDVEIDPIAYALKGYSLHAGFTWDRVRLDLGAFALEVPESLHGALGLDVYGSGFGAKLDVHPLRSLPGLFVGAQLSRFRETVTSQATGEAKTSSHVTVGARIGYKVDITSGFYVLPWVGVDIALTDRDQQIGALDYEPGRAMFFPTVHFGKSF